MPGLSLETSIPTKDVMEPSMEISQPCGCELDGERRLWRLFGLVPQSRRRSCLVTVLRDRGTIDLPPAAVGKPASLRSAAFPTVVPITPSVLEEANIQGTKTQRKTKKQLSADFADDADFENSNR